MESIQNLITRLKNSESRTSNSNINKIDTFLINRYIPYNRK